MKKTPPDPSWARRCFLLFSSLTGKQNDLLIFCFLPKNIHGGGVADIVEAHQCIVQDQRRFGSQFLGDRQPQGKIQLIYGALAAPLGGVENGLAFGGGIDAQPFFVNTTPDEIAREVDRVRSILGPNIVISPSHERILPNVPIENLTAMARAAKK